MNSEMLSMVSVPHAIELIRNHVTPLQPRKITLAEANGCFLAEDIFALYNIPAFPQSGMDGYAFQFESLGKPIQLIGEIAAGSKNQVQVEPGKAVRIFTGAPVPPGADTVVMQEKTKRSGNELIIEDLQISIGQNIRAIGSEITAGQLALHKDVKLNAASIGFIASIGINELLVHPKPRVSIIVTGNELQNPGTPLTYGQVYEANSYTLEAALEFLHIKEIRKTSCPDNLEQLKSMLKNELEISDLILLTGGVSVGDYDFTSDAFDACEVKKIFHKVKQKPGKPILFGMYGEKTVFGLPGNPASVLTCFYEYVYQALSIMMMDAPALKKVQAKLNDPYIKPSGITHILKAFCDDGKVQLLTGQESYKLNSFAAANALAIIPESVSEMQKGSMIEVHILPG